MMGINKEEEEEEEEEEEAAAASRPKEATTNDWTLGWVELARAWTSLSTCRTTWGFRAWRREKQEEERRPLWRTFITAGSPSLQAKEIWTRLTRAL